MQRSHGEHYDDYKYRINGKTYDNDHEYHDDLDYDNSDDDDYDVKRLAFGAHTLYSFSYLKV